MQSNYLIYESVRVMQMALYRNQVWCTEALKTAYFIFCKINSHLPSK